MAAIDLIEQSYISKSLTLYKLMITLWNDVNKDLVDHIQIWHIWKVEKRIPNSN